MKCASYITEQEQPQKRAVQIAYKGRKRQRATMCQGKAINPARATLGAVVEIWSNYAPQHPRQEPTRRGGRSGFPQQTSISRGGYAAKKGLHTHGGRAGADSKGRPTFQKCCKTGKAWATYCQLLSVGRQHYPPTPRPDFFAICMRERLQISKGTAAAVQAGPHSLSIHYDDQGRLGIMDDGGAWIPPQRFSDRVFPVFDNHQANSDKGTGAEAIRASADGATTDAPEPDAAALCRELYHAAKVHPLAPAAVLIKTYEPTISGRELGRRLKLGHSAAADMLDKLIERRPVMRRLLRSNRQNAAQAQRQRRKRERGVFYE